MNRDPLPQEFYERPVEQVAPDLLGAFLHAETEITSVVGRIVETEAYGGPEDLASHAAFRKTGYVQWMWGAPGTIYVYKAYGMYPCLNIVTGPEGEPSAVLIRAMSIVVPELDNRSASGPGRLGRHVGLDTHHNGHELMTPPYWVTSSEDLPGHPVTGPRVGVKRGDGRHWRFAISQHPAVSRPRP
jgi:DNA-3-methyladenine glycosylase